MVVRIRLARPPGATKLTTHYHIVVVDAKKRRDAKPLEILGIYDPKLHPARPDKRVEWSVDRLRYWVGVGAEPTKTVVHLLD
ncbi:ribosomal protein S16, partial [Clavulina sp. PMI_390]